MIACQAGCCFNSPGASLWSGLVPWCRSGLVPWCRCIRELMSGCLPVAQSMAAPRTVPPGFAAEVFLATVRWVLWPAMRGQRTVCTLLRTRLGVSALMHRNPQRFQMM